MNNAPKPTWGAIKDTLEKMVAFPAVEGWHVSREAADKALEWITWAETHQPNPVPKILPEEDEDVSLVWHTADGWAVHRTFPKDDEPYWLAMPSARPEALASSPEVDALIREAEARGMERAAELLLPEDDQGVWRGSWFEPALRQGQTRIRAEAEAMLAAKATP